METPNENHPCPGVASDGVRAASVSAVSSDGGSSACHSGLLSSAAAALSGESKETVVCKAPAPGGAVSKKVAGKRCDMALCP